MASQPIYESIRITENRGSVNERKKIECKTDILTEGILKVLNVSAFTTINNCNAENGKVSYGGKVVFFICYETTDGEIKKCECGSEYIGELEGLNDVGGCRVKCSAEVIKTESDKTQMKLIAVAYLQINATAYENKTYSALSGGDGLICDQKEQTYRRGYGIKDCSYTVEEDFDISFAIQEVLYHNANAIVTAVQCGVGTIIIDGKVIMSAVLLQNGEKPDIIKEEKVLPFRAEVEYEDAMPSMSAVATVREKSFKSDISVDEERGVSAVSVSVNLQFETEAFTDQTVTVATDVFSLSEDVKTEKAELVANTTLDERICEVRISGTANVDETPDGSALKALAGERVEIVASENADGNIKLTGTLSGTGYFVNAEGKFFTRRLETPFETITSCNVGSDAKVDVIIKTQNADGKIISKTEAEISAGLIIAVIPKQNNKISYIKDVQLLGAKQKNQNAISVYLALDGEELWSLAKRLNVSPESILETNTDLTFPLSGKERIVVYRQKA